MTSSNRLGEIVGEAKNHLPRDCFLVTVATDSPFLGCSIQEYKARLGRSI